jgi:hypothetical protein
MRLSSVRDLKAELAARTQTEFVERSALTPRLARDVRLPRPVLQPVAAFGVARQGRGRDDFALAIRVFKGSEARARQLTEPLHLKDAEIDLATGVRYAPRFTLRAGGSCGHFNITSGTLGGFVEDDEDYYILSNNHVLANSDDANVGDEILQPGPDDIEGGRFKVIGRLARWNQLSPRRRNGIDAALATFHEDVADFYPWHYAGVGDMKPRVVEDRLEVSRVIKRGRTTQVTRGIVSAFELDGVFINYGSRRRERLVYFDDQLEFIHVRPETSNFSDGGDSGSFILDAETLRPYALLYGGGPDAQGIDRTLGHFMPDVLSSLKVRLVK